VSGGGYRGPREVLFSPLALEGFRDRDTLSAGELLHTSLYGLRTELSCPGEISTLRVEKSEQHHL
jgi:hypothetical protein